MKITNTKSLISFQKKLVATCSVQKDNHPLHCNIFELNKEDDEFYFENLEKKKSGKQIGTYTKLVVLWKKILLGQNDFSQLRTKKNSV